MKLKGESGFRDNRADGPCESAEGRRSFAGAVRHLAAVNALVCLVAAVGGGCASREPSFFERMLSGNPEEGRGLSPELRLECSHPAAEVLLDGVLQGHCADFTGQGLALSEGAHFVEVRLPGHLPFEAVVEPGRARMSLRVDLVAVR